jgi:two-component system chemotaxis sensor kinase CheA
MTRGPEEKEARAASVAALGAALARHLPGSDLAPVRAEIDRARALARGRGWLETALERTGAVLAGLEDASPEERFERFELALDAVDALGVAAEGPPGPEPTGLIAALTRCLASSAAEDEVRREAPPPGAASSPGAAVTDAVEDLSGEIVALTGPADSAGFKAIEQGARDLRSLVMKAGGGAPTLFEALERVAAFAGAASRGELPAGVDARSALSAVASVLGAAATGDALAAQEIGAAVSAGAPAQHRHQEHEHAVRAASPTLPTARVEPAPPPTAANAPTIRVEPETTLALGGEREILDGFVVEAREHLANAEGKLLVLEETPTDATVIADLFRAFHSIKGVAGLLGLSPIVRLTHALESLLDAARKKTRDLDRPGIDALLEARDVLQAQVDRVAAALERSAAEVSLPGPERLIATLEAVLAGKAAPPPPPAPRPAPASPPTAPMPAPAPVTIAVPPPPVARETLVMPSAPAPGRESLAGVRVPMDRLDHLVELVGEMVISQAQVGHDLAVGDPDAPLAKETNRLGKITREVQDLSMTLRMLPIQPLFQKIQRLVRDLNRTTGKQVRLETEGEETRLDKSFIDELEDPLVHMVRNSVDHGIETPEERRAAGKPEQGVIRIAASHAGGEVVLTIRDDGKGLDRDRILAKARERGLAPLDQVPPEQTIFGYIFEAGLSTAQKVTELSGRGVGMDVVKRNIQKLRGKIEIESQRGAGTRFSIKLPLTLAIIDGMVVRVGNERFTLPNFTIEEALQLKAGQLVTAYGRGEMVKIRGQLAPFVRLRTVFDLPGEATEAPNLVIMVEVAGERCALGVDEILGQQQIVIKSLEPPFNRVRAIAGATVLGDGRVGLILDVAALIAMALHPETLEQHAELPVEEPPPRAPLEGKYLIAALGDEEYGLPVLSVQEIVTMLPVTAIPLVPSFVRGVVNLRGHVIPVVDLRTRLGMEPIAPLPETCIVVIRLARRTVGVIVDSVREVLNLKRESTKALPNLGPSLRADYMTGVGTAGERIAFLLDVERVLAARELLTHNSEARV